MEKPNLVQVVYHARFLQLTKEGVCDKKLVNEPTMEFSKKNHCRPPCRASRRTSA